MYNIIITCVNPFLLIDDCAVIDEIQMIKDSDRGWAWSRALLGEFTTNKFSFNLSLKAQAKRNNAAWIFPLI